ncbi:MAG: NAD(P)-binding protein, partial [Candidatus Aminicenantes bacterium]|nr:NAD(P)-binding protein [Candidatus Aminicenantes bacterium]
MKNNKKVLILGGGITGLGVAWKLAENNVPVEVIEAKKEEIGGLAATIKRDPYRLDYGPHFFLSEKPELIEKITGLFEEELPAFERKAQLYFHGRFYNYPLTARNVLLQMPISDTLLSTASYFSRLLWDSLKKSLAARNKDPNFEEWAKSSFGS